MANNFPFLAFAGGEVGKEALSRVKLEGYAATAEIMENWLPETSGPMQLRPGFLFKTQPNAASAFTHLIPFVKAVSTKYLLLLSDGELRIAYNGGVVARSAVSSTISGGEFASVAEYALWTSISAGGGSTAYDTGRLKLVSDGTSIAGVRQTVTTGDIGATHGLEITVSRGPVYIAIGSTAGGVDILGRTSLRTGYHNLSFVPTNGTYYIDIWSTSKAIRYLDRIAIAAAGDIVLTTPWAESTLRSLRYEQSGDVVTISSGATRRQRIERRGASSWSVVDTNEIDGPFLDPNTDEAITITPSVTSGNGTLTASASIFESGHVGALFQITHGGQLVERAITNGGQFSDSIKVQGTSTGRTFSYAIAGTWSGTVWIQRSIGNDTSWANYSSFTANASSTITDTLDNQIVYYRIGIPVGSYTSGTANVSLTYTGGSSSGVARVTAYTSPTSVEMEVVDSFAGITASSEWAEWAWSSASNGMWAKGTALFDGRMWDSYGDKFVGSVSDGYESYEAGDEADKAVLRTVATGKVNPGQWVMPLSRLLIGTEGAEVEVRSSSFDEPLTPSNNTVRAISTYGSADVQPVTIDTRGYFVERSGVRVMELVYSVEKQGYSSQSLMRMHKNVGRPGVVQLAVSRQPDTRVLAVRSDGQLLCSLSEPGDDVSGGWTRLIAGGTDAEIESVAVLPGDGEDEIYVMVKRTIDGATVRYLEQMAPLYVEIAADAVCCDSALVFENPATTTLSVPHLVGQTVAILADGAKMPDQVVNGAGEITLSKLPDKAVVGLRYNARYKSSKLAFGAELGTALGQKGRALHIILLLLESMPTLRFGSSFETTGTTAMVELKDRQIETQYDTGPGLITGTTEQMAMPGRHERDPRVCLTAESPHHVRLAGYVVSRTLNERV